MGWAQRARRCRGFRSLFFGAANKKFPRCAKTFFTALSNEKRHETEFQLEISKEEFLELRDKIPEVSK